METFSFKLLISVAIGIALAFFIIFILKLVFRLLFGIVGYFYGNFFGVIITVGIIGYVIAEYKTETKYCLDNDGTAYKSKYVSASDGFIANLYFGTYSGCNEISFEKYKELKKNSRDETWNTLIKLEKSIYKSIGNWNEKRKQKKMHEEWLKNKDKREIDKLRDEIDDLKRNQQNLDNTFQDLTIIDEDGNSSNCILENDILHCM